MKQLVKAVAGAIFGLFLGIVVLGMLVAGSTIYVVLCVIEFLIVMAFAVVWFVFPLGKTEQRYQTADRITKTGERNTWIFEAKSVTALRQ